MAFYTNKKGKKVQLIISRHAMSQFVQRYKLAFPKKDLDYTQVPALFDKFFSESKRVTKFNRKQNTRLKRYGKDTMFFKTNFFTFVVQNGEVRTVELSNKNMRKLNSVHHQSGKNFRL